jgi:transposase
MSHSTLAQITLPLDIPNVDVLSVKKLENGKYVITVESAKQTFRCGICNQKMNCNYGHGSTIRLRHLPVFGLETYIEIQPKRGQCQSCEHRPTTTQNLDWYEQRSPHTKAFDQYLVKQLIGTTVADVSLKEKVNYDAVLGTLRRQVATELNWDEVQNLGTIGIDEVAHKKGQNSYRAVIYARQDNGTTLVLGVLDDRKKKR